MNIVLDIDDVDYNNIFLDDKTKNTIIDNGVFYKLHYSNNILEISNIIVKLDINKYNIFKNYHRFKCVFSTDKYKTIIDKITKLEQTILQELYINKTCDTFKQANYNISTVLHYGCFKLSRYPNNNNNIALKISGIWETENNYGLTYKFILI